MKKVKGDLTFDQYIDPEVVLPLTAKEEGWWLFAVPVTFLGTNHEISAMKISETRNGKRLLVAFDRYSDGTIDMAQSFIINKDDELNTYDVFTKYVSDVLKYLAKLILGLEEQYPDENVNLEDEPIFLDVPEPAQPDRKYLIDRFIAKGGCNVLQNNMG